mmetsp:Transcript_78612/g.179934  ORF Transcript_78612/g.179934 Transcript_78612/m.179934 type:complete len:605 (+) Transcript_78612:30-1844(+)
MQRLSGPLWDGLRSAAPHSLPPRFGRELRRAPRAAGLQRWYSGFALSTEAHLAGQGGARHSPGAPSAGRGALQGVGRRRWNSSKTGGFREYPLSAHSLRAIDEIFAYEVPTETQAAVLPYALSLQEDLVVQAKTGTGKTMAYLLPAIEAVVAQPPVGIGVIIIAPTRELSQQILAEAEKLLTFSPYGVAGLVGGSSRKSDQALLKKRRPQIIVATPGRLLDHLESTFLFSSLVDQTSLLVLDECDRLLELGFQETLRSILDYLPEQRRNLLLSATVTQGVQDMCGRVCSPAYRFVDCVENAEAPTAEQVDQEVVVVPPLMILTSLFHVLFEEMQKNQYTHKIMVFFPTARTAAFFSSLFRKQLRMQVYEMHSRREQRERETTAARFGHDRCGVMFSSDVSARGMDYPNVTLVVQVGAPGNLDEYIHRIGRTARAGKGGKGVLILSDSEAVFMDRIKDLPVQRRKDPALMHQSDLLIRATTSWTADAQLHWQAASAFASLLTHYKLQKRALSMSDTEVIQTANTLLLGCGMLDQPPISRKLAEKLKLEDHPELKVAEDLHELQGLEQLHDSTLREAGRSAAKTQRLKDQALAREDLGVDVLRPAR